MSFSESEMVQLGSRFSTQKLIEQANVSIAVARAHAAELGSRFPQAKVDELEQNIGKAQKLFDEQAEKKLLRATGNVPVAALVADAKRWLSDLIAAADNAFEEDQKLADQYHKAGKLGRSVPRICGRIEELISQANQHKAELAAWGFVAADFDRGSKVLTYLRAADTTQERAVKDLPPKTRELYALKGSVYLSLKRLARAGRRAFATDPTSASKLDLEILNRHAHKRVTSDNPA